MKKQQVLPGQLRKWPTCELMIVVEKLEEIPITTTRDGDPVWRCSVYTDMRSNKGPRGEIRNPAICRYNENRIRDHTELVSEPQ